MLMSENQKRIFIIAELHPQYGGSMETLTTMILQSKLYGADAVKVQLYDTQELHGDTRRKYLQLEREELTKAKEYADQVGIEFFASVFDMERLGWCEDLNFTRYKIASRTVQDEDLCKAIIKTGKPVLISLGNYPWQDKGFPFQETNLVYLYCVTNYPTMLEEIRMPEFSESGFLGFSDHTLGISASLYAVSKGAIYIEKHFTLNKGLQKGMEKGHAGSMDMEDLKRLRELSDAFLLLRQSQG